MKNLVLILSIFFLSNQLKAQNDWSTISLPTTENLTEIQFVNDSVGFIAGEKGVLLKTTDSGITWILINTPGTVNILSLAFISETEGGILLGNNFGQAIFYMTYDNGTTWQVKSASFNGFCFPYVLFAVEDRILIGGNGCFYGDGISLFVNDTLAMDTMLNWFGTIKQFDFINDSIGFASSAEASLYKTIDGGYHWSIIDLPDSITQIYDIAFQDEMTGYLVGIDTFDGSWAKVVFKTVDGGSTWTDDVGALFVTPKFTDVAMFAPDSFIIAGHYQENANNHGTVWFNFYGPNPIGFTEWWQVDTTAAKPKKNDLVVQNRCIYIIGDNGFLSINCYKNNTTSIEVKNMEDNDVKIYPNPTVNQLTILSKEFDFNEIEIIDVTGKVAITVKKETDIINVADLPAGIYFINLISNNRTISKKFVKE